MIGIGTTNGMCYTKQPLIAPNFDNFFWITFDYYDKNWKKSDTNRYTIMGF